VPSARPSKVDLRNAPSVIPPSLSDSPLIVRWIALGPIAACSGREDWDQCFPEI
jgi:hypothetical protein